MDCVKNLLAGIDIIKIDGEHAYDLYNIQNREWTAEQFLLALEEMRGKEIIIEKIQDEKMFRFFRDLPIDNVLFQGNYFHKGCDFLGYFAR